MEPPHIRDESQRHYNGIPYSNILWLRPSRKIPIHSEISSHTPSTKLRSNNDIGENPSVKLWVV